MASYHLSMKKISRGKGHSCVSKAAYRCGEELEDSYYGERADYSRKQGVEHSEILAPDDAPDWVQDRAALWSAVEFSENRNTNRKWRGAQLAFELELALPHELDADQRRELVRRFVQEQLVSQGMVADLNIHVPHRDGDQRNHHAHVMLTMREIRPDGFGDRRPEWWGGEKDRKSDIVKEYRASWADYQNAEFERLGLSVRVDHRSLQDQGVDREPEAKEGPSATAMKRKNKDSRVVSENEARAERNENRSAHHVEALKELAKVAAERQRFDVWATERKSQLEAAQHLSQLDLEHAQSIETDALELRLKDFYGESLRTVEYEAERVESRLNAKGIIPTLRRAFLGRTEREKLEALQATIKDTYARMQEQRDRLAKEHAIDRARLAQKQEERKQAQHEGIEKARAKKEETLAAQARDAQNRAAKSGEPDKRMDSLRAEIERNRAERAAQRERGPELD